MRQRNQCIRAYPVCAVPNTGLNSSSATRAQATWHWLTARKPTLLTLNEAANIQNARRGNGSDRLHYAMQASPVPQNSTPFRERSAALIMR